MLEQSRDESAYPRPAENGNGHERTCVKRDMGAAMFFRSPDMPDMLTLVEVKWE